MSYRQIRRAVTDLGCEFVRQGKGDHEIWVNPHGIKFPIPRKSVNHGLSRKILFDARRLQCQTT